MFKPSSELRDVQCIQSTIYIMHVHSDGYNLIAFIHTIMGHERKAMQHMYYGTLPEPRLEVPYMRTRDSILLAVFEFSNRGGLDIIMIAYLWTRSLLEL